MKPIHRYEVTNELIIHCQIKTLVDAESPSAAMDAAINQLPMNIRPERGKSWKADVTVKPPKGVVVTSCRAIHFDTASGGEKARKVTTEPVK
jgi:hypothetical protein